MRSERLALVALGLALLLMGGWLMRYRHDYFESGGTKVPIRENRFTGTTEMLVFDHWQRMERPKSDREIALALCSKHKELLDIAFSDNEFRGMPNAQKCVNLVELIRDEDVAFNAFPRDYQLRLAEIVRSIKER
jgi:hypothetical protein